MTKMKLTLGGAILLFCITIPTMYYWNYSSIVDINIHESTLYTKRNLLPPTTVRKLENDIRARERKDKPIIAMYKTGEEATINDNYVDIFKSEKYHRAKLIDTEGCKIPKVMVDYPQNNKEDTKQKKCGQRGVLLKKLDGKSVVATIKKDVLSSYLKFNDSYYCCYQFILRADTLPVLLVSRYQRNLLRDKFPRKTPMIYSNCTKFEDNFTITLQTDFINIKCFEYSDDINPIYDDVYPFVKKNKVRNLPEPNLKCKKKYNVLIIGMNSMSLPHAGQTLPRTVTFFHNEFWNGFRGYHKIADDTMSNLMAVFTGKNMSKIEENCSGKMDTCNDFMIWSKFKDVGYVTAYGEDYLPETFANEYEFREKPTDHYIKPLFLGEYKRDNVLCSGKVRSGKQILDYALDFTNTYKNDSFFGVFWLNSFSHEVRSHPEDVDKTLEMFFYQLSKTDIMLNTFVIFFSDQGSRFGRQRVKMEGYYENRMPIFFMWVPIDFKKTHTMLVPPILKNQYRLVTPYDIYGTLTYIRTLSTCSNKIDSPEGCPKCHTTFRLINTNRTCSDVTISDSWCSCHKMYPISTNDPERKKPMDLVINYLNTMMKEIKTQRCWSCQTLTLKTIYRIHFYYGKQNVDLYYVVAFSMTPGNVSYEATVVYNTTTPAEFIAGPVSYLNSYSGHGACVENYEDHLFCVCKKLEDC